MNKYKSYAKINFGLYITDKREDGYHDLSSIFLPIDFFDLMEFKKIEDKTIKYEVSGLKDHFPVNNTNTVSKAFYLMKEKYSINGGLELKIHKNIPSGAGLGGGSSNAATTIRAINDIFSLNLDTYELKKIAKKIGADVPFFIDSVPSYVEGIGDKIKHFKLLEDYYVLILKPKLGISSSKIYSNVTFNLTLKSLNARNQKLLKDIAFNGMKDKESFKLISNDLEKVSVKLDPYLLKVRSYLEGLKPLSLMMTGSGSAFYALFDRDIRKDKGLEDHEDFLCKTKIMRGHYGDYRS
jgi:4-diphosphocytidyl-2-C-methyl-D-erythritol kinase